MSNLFNQKLTEIRSQGTPGNRPQPKKASAPQRLPFTGITRAPSPTNIEEMRAGAKTQHYYRLNRFQKQDLKTYADSAYSLTQQLAALWTQTVNTRRDYLMIAEELVKYYILDGLLDMITGDVLNPDPAGNIVSFSSQDPEIQDELDELQDIFDFDQILSDITPELINYGEYTLAMSVREGEGVVSLDDNVDQLNCVAFYERGYPVNYLMWEDNDYYLYPAHNFVHFCVGRNRIRVRMDSTLSTSYALGQDSQVPDHVKNKLPDYVRCGKPFFFGIVSKLRELQLLEQLIPAIKLNQITQSQFVTVHLPNNLDPGQAFDVVQRYEDMLNVPTGVDFTREQLSLSEIMSVAGRIRVVPTYDDSKGSLETADLRKSQAVDDIMAAVQDIRKTILTSIGIPPSLLFGADSVDGEKSNELRMFSRYTRKLAAFQRSLAHGLKQVCLAHLVNRGFNVNAKDIEITFKESIVDLSGLEKLEFDDAKSDILSRTMDLINAIQGCEIANERLDREAVREFLQEKIQMATGFNFFKEEEQFDGDDLNDQFGFDDGTMPPSGGGPMPSGGGGSGPPGLGSIAPPSGGGGGSSGPKPGGGGGVSPGTLKAAGLNVQPPPG
jgi:hypothetical protein